MVRGPRLRSLTIATGILVVAAAVASAMVLSGSSTSRRVPSVSSPSSTRPTPPVPRFSRTEAEAAARKWASGVVTREASKLSTNEIISDFLNAWESGQSTVDLPGRLNPLIGPPANREEWVVALSGSISRRVAWEPESLPPGSVPWAVITFDATTGDVTSGYAASPSSDVTWPPGWDQISDMAG
jgi:hypothetical protein